jgi:hypothetical protein
MKSMIFATLFLACTLQLFSTGRHSPRFTWGFNSKSSLKEYPGTPLPRPASLSDTLYFSIKHRPVDMFRYNTSMKVTYTRYNHESLDINRIHRFVINGKFQAAVTPLPAHTFVFSTFPGWTWYDNSHSVKLKNSIIWSLKKGPIKLHTGYSNSIKVPSAEEMEHKLTVSLYIHNAHVDAVTFKIAGRVLFNQEIMASSSDFPLKSASIHCSIILDWNKVSSPSPFNTFQYEPEPDDDY